MKSQKLDLGKGVSMKDAQGGSTSIVTVDNNDQSN